MSLRPTRMEVSFDALLHNYRSIKELVKRAKVIAVLKANAYGMGLIPAARCLKADGADFFAVATPDEALEIRASGIKDPVLVLGSSPYGAAETYVKEDIQVAITDLEMARALSQKAVALGRPASIHLKIDSGMGRIGFLPKEALEAALAIKNMPGLDIKGLFTHFATADEADLSYTHHQFQSFMDTVEKIKKAGISAPMLHCSNSGAILANLSEMFLDAVRPGHILNGLVPSQECGSAIEIKPCFELKTAVGVVRHLEKGSGVSYGLTYTTSGNTCTAVLPVGYADGFSRAFSNNADVLIQGKRCPVIGRICMDQSMVDVSHLENVRAGDEVVLLGRQGNEYISIEEWANKLSTNVASVPLGLSSRVTRVYL